MIKLKYPSPTSELQWSEGDKEFFKEQLGEGNEVPDMSKVKKVAQYLYNNYFSQLVKFNKFPTLTRVRFEYKESLYVTAGKACSRYIQLSKPYIRNYGVQEIPTILTHEMIHLVDTKHGDEFKRMLCALQTLGCRVFKYSKGRAKERQTLSIKEEKEKEKKANYKLECWDCGNEDYLVNKSQRVKMMATKDRVEPARCTNCDYSIDLYVKDKNNEWQSVSSGYEGNYVDNPEKWVNNPKELILDKGQ